MKKYLLLLPVVALLVLATSSCKERGSIADFQSSVKAHDTSYIAAAETPEPHRVYVEEFTGVTCPTCPFGHAILKGYEDQNPGRVVIVGIHTGEGQAKPHPVYSKQDFRTEDGGILAGVLGAPPFLPAGSIDRTPFPPSGELLNDRNSWTAKFDERKAIVTPVNLSVTSQYREASRDAIVKVRIAFTGAVSKKLVLNMAVTESGLIDFQDFPTTDTTLNYIHNHILRDLITPATGSPFLTSIAVKQPGQVFERTFLYAVDSKWNPDNCRIVASVSIDEQNDKEVLQAVEANLR